MTARYNLSYSFDTDIWTLGYGEVGPSEEATLQLPGEIPDGDWVIEARVFHLMPNSAAGLMVILPTVTVEFLVGAADFTTDNPDVLLVHGGTHLRVDYISDDNALVFYLDGVQVSSLMLDVAPVEVGLILRYADELLPALALLDGARLLPGKWDDYDPYAITEIDIDPRRVTEPQGRGVVTPLTHSALPEFTYTTEPMVYAFVGAPYGDMEFDVGKSCRWLEYYSDRMFVLDVNLGTPRYWIVNWALTFPDAEHAVTNINYFERPADFRKEELARAQFFYTLDPNGWVLFIDGSEGLSFDNSSLPNDYDIAPFMSWIWREITRAETAGQDTVVIPHFVFLRSAEIQNVTYDHRSNPANPDDPEAPQPVLQPISVPYYLPYQGMARLFKVSRLLNSSFNWASLDTFATPTSGVKCQVISYAYAHWNLQDIPPGETDVPALSEANDDGFRMRQQISRIRPVTGLQFATWNNGSTDVPGVPGPWAVYTTTNTDPSFTPITDTDPTDPNSATHAVDTPLYDCAFRLNMRDGVWYEGGVSGNTPLVWNPDEGKWMTPYDPELWPTYGAESPFSPGAPPNPDYVDPPTPVP